MRPCLGTSVAAFPGGRVWRTPEGDGYLMDHSTFMYLMNPAGEYVTHFGYGISAEDLAARLAEATGGSGV
jgi:cytochrome oxidase Cu insertion factor (SCO1/SenC/PrrC family)